MQLTLFKKLDLGKTLYHLGQYQEAQTLLLEGNKGLGASYSVKYGKLTNRAHWYLAKIWLGLGKCDQSKELALKTINLTQEDLGAQHVFYREYKEELRQLWGINPDGTPFEGSVELGTDDSRNECGTDNSSERVAETPWQGNAEQ